MYRLLPQGRLLRVLLAVCASAALALAAACGTSGDAAAPWGGGESSAEGFLMHHAGTTQLCRSLLESHPPKCGGVVVRVEGLDLESIAGLRTAEGVTWSSDYVRLTGQLRDGVLTVG